KGFVVFSAPQAEVRTLRVTKDGIYAGTSSPTRRRGAGGTTASAGGSASGLTGASPMSVSTTKQESDQSAQRTALATGATNTASGGREPSRGEVASAPTPPSAGENSLYHISPDGAVREVFREKTLVLCHLRQNGRIFVGTGMDGQLFEVE